MNPIKILFWDTYFLAAAMLLDLRWNKGAYYIQSNGKLMVK